MPRAVQEDRHAPRHRVAAVAVAGQVLRRRRAGVGGRRASTGSATTCSTPTTRCGRRRRRTTSSHASTRVAAAVPPGAGGVHLHAVAQRRAHAGRRPPAARRLAQPLACERRAPTWCARCSKGLRTTRAGCSEPSRSSSDGRSRALNFVGGGAQSRAVVSDHGRRARPADPPGRARRCTRTRGARRCSPPSRSKRIDARRHRPQRWRSLVTFQPDRAGATVYDALYREFRAVHKQNRKSIYARARTAMAEQWTTHD